MIRKALLSIPFLSVLAVIFAAGIVYAAVSGTAAGGGVVTQFTTDWGDCRSITNNNAKALFVPAKTTGEWNAFLNNASNKTVSSCCVAYAGQACNSTANSCGQTNSGTYTCGGACSASAPANPANYGNVCSSSANSCGQTNSGTIQCNGTCSASVPTNPAGYGNACSSSPNSCGATNSGTIQCNGTCSASTPANPPPVYQCDAPYCVGYEEYCASYTETYECDFSGNCWDTGSYCDSWESQCTGWAQNCQWVSGC